jgi:hypothetical protein
MSKRPIAWVEDHGVAESRHGGVRDQELEALGARHFEGRWQGDAMALAHAAWEAGWDSAVLAAIEWLQDPERLNRAQEKLREMFKVGGVQFAKETGYAIYGTLARQIVQAADGGANDGEVA